MLPVSLIVIEGFFFSNLFDYKKFKKLIFSIFLSGTMILLIGLWLLPYGQYLSKLYEFRTFSIIERLLVQPRVLIFYLSQIFFPTPERFSIAHDFILSSSIVNPWTILPAIIFIFSLIGFGLYQIRSHQLISFAIFFFFLNHIIESTVLPLEIVFEHRNYLPSMFLFVPISFGLNVLLMKYHYQKKRFIFLFIVIIAISIPINFSISTYIRNKVWENDILLWADAYKKAPNNARAANILAIKLAWDDNSKHPLRYDKALDLFEKSLNMHMPSVKLKADILGNMASVYSNNKQNYKRAVELYAEALAINPDSLKIRYDMANTLILEGNYEEALKNLSVLILKNGKNWNYHNLKGFCLLWLEKYNEAFPNFQRAFSLIIERKGTYPKGLLLNLGVNLSLKGEYQLARNILEDMIKDDKQRKKTNFDNLPVYFALIDNSLRAHDGINAQRYASQMVTIFGKEIVLDNIDKLVGNRALAPLSKMILGPVNAVLEMRLNE
jgi:tetratricopeptide (TPR) repeat protein